MHLAYAMCLVLASLLRFGHSSPQLAANHTTGDANDAHDASDVVRQLTDSDYEIEDDSTESTSNDDGDMDVEGRNKAAAKPTRYHYYPHNQHVYLLPECATQQVCNAVYTRLNFTQPLCACADRFQGPCSASIGRNDQHTIPIGYKKNSKIGPSGKREFKSPTLVKTCEATSVIRQCRSPQDWALLALQNMRTGKSQYLVICRCDRGELDGPMSHDQPTYARVPGIRVYGMMCTSRTKRTRQERSSDPLPFPWHKVTQFASTLVWD